MTRPITDRVKQSLFDILAPDLPGATVYDCFAGTGSMGLECLSRGATAVTFFESDRSAVSRLKTNIAALQDAARSRVVEGDLFRWFTVHAPLPPSERVSLIFLDPPYRFLRERPDDLKTLARRFADNHLSREGLVIFRHDADDALELPGLGRHEQRVYGGMTLEFLAPARNGA